MSPLTLAVVCFAALAASALANNDHPAATSAPAPKFAKGKPFFNTCVTVDWARNKAGFKLLPKQRNTPKKNSLLLELATCGANSCFRASRCTGAAAKARLCKEVRRKTGSCVCVLLCASVCMGVHARACLFPPLLCAFPLTFAFLPSFLSW
jgi:hypothetical protein